MKVAIIDMEGVIVDGEYLPKLSRIVGKEKEVEEITLKGISGEINWEDGLKQRIEILKGIEYKDALKVANEMPLMKNANKFCKKLKEMGFKIVMVTGGFSIVAERVKEELDLDHVISNELVFDNDKLTGIRLKVNDKAKTFIKNFGRIDGDVVAIADGANDLDLFKIANIKIAFNAQAVVKKMADFVVDGKDLGNLIPLMEKLFQKPKK